MTKANQRSPQIVAHAVYIYNSANSMPDKLPEGWVMTTLGEVCALNPRSSHDELPSEGTEVSFVPMAAVGEESGRLDATCIRVLGAVRRGYTPFKENDVIFAKITPCMENGKIALATGLKNGLAYGSTEFFVLRPYEGLSPRFVLYFLLQAAFRQEAERCMTGGVGQKRVPSKFLSTHAFPLPPTQEQERIVSSIDSMLARVSKGEAAAQRALERLKNYRTSLINAGVTGALTQEWRKTNKTGETGSQLLKRVLKQRRTQWELNEFKHLSAIGKPPANDKWKLRYKEPYPLETDELPTIPNGWTWASLEMIAQLGSGISVSQSRIVDNPIELPYLRVANVLRGAIDLSQIKKIRVDKDNLDSFLLRTGDILFNEGGDRDKLGRGWVWEGQIPKCVHQNHVFRARLFDPSLIDGKLVSHWGNTFGQQFFIHYGTQSTNLASINRSVLAKLPIPIAPLKEQEVIARELKRRLAGADQLAVKLEQQLTQARATRESLLYEAFAGRLVSQDPKDESGNALLHRILAHREAESESRAKYKSTPRPDHNYIRKGSAAMNKTVSNLEALHAAWQQIGKNPDAQLLFETAGFTPSQVIEFYTLLKTVPEMRQAFEPGSKATAKEEDATQNVSVEETKPVGHFRLVTLWLENFKNLKDYKLHFDSSHGLDVILGWNGTGKSNLFEALVIIFRDLHYWLEKNKWPDSPMSAYLLTYEINGFLVEVTWNPAKMKRPEVSRGAILENSSSRKLVRIKRGDLPLPRFVFGYYSGPTNRLAEHFLPMKHDHYERLRDATSDDPRSLAELIEQRRFFCAETHHAKYVLLAFSHKEDPKISRFLENRLRIVGFESALFVIRRPLWGKGKVEDFWGAKGVMRRVMERLKRFAIAPMVLKQTVREGYRSTSEQHYYFFLPDKDSLHAFAAEYGDARSFFVALESTDFSELIHDVKIQVRVKGADSKEISITFRELSEGEQQLLMVLGLMRFTKSHQSLVLLDEPDTHLNPHWSVDYLKDIASVTSDDDEPSPEQQTSQLLMATHDPLVIASLLKDQVHLLKREKDSLRCYWQQASVNPRGLGYTGILTSEMFGFRSDLDPETLQDLDDRVRLIAKEGELSPAETETLEEIDKRLSVAGFSKAFSDPYYAAFVRAWGRRDANEMAGKNFLTQEEQKEVDQIAQESLIEATAELEKEIKS